MISTKILTETQNALFKSQCAIYNNITHKFKRPDWNADKKRKSSPHHTVKVSPSYT